ncbi:MAG: polysaccharide deacetylase family protein [Armatimonadota bacterium]|nr:polysaccharide deacetylase family protein [bacterium]MDW8320227.1 polysaccharide deacetylase family protein [Armatimonadota bacterium]
MASRKRSTSRRRSGRVGRLIWALLQLALVVVGVLVVAVYVSRSLPPAPDAESGRTSTTSPQPKQPVRHAPANSQPRVAAGSAREPSREPVQTPQTVPPPSGSSAAEAAAPRNLKVTPSEIDAGSTSQKLVALTFDAGSSAEPVPRILQALARQSVHCTFFLTGQWIERYPDAARQIAEAGHELGNHSWSHPAFTSLTDEQIREQLRRTEEIAQRVCGRSTKPLFRPPFGARNERVRSVVAEEGYLTIYWSIDSWDSVKKDITPQMIINRVMRAMRPGAIVLMHCGSEATAQALPRLLGELEAQGYRVVTVSELLALSDGEP